MKVLWIKPGGSAVKRGSWLGSAREPFPRDAKEAEVCKRQNKSGEMGSGVASASRWTRGSPVASHRKPETRLRLLLC